VKLYPDVPARRTRAITADAISLTLLVLAALSAWWIYEAVSELTVLGTGVRDAGTAIEGGFTNAAGAVDGIPLVGGRIADGLRDAGAGSGGELADLGRTGEERVHDLALALGLSTFVLPALLLLAIVGPRRIRQVRDLTAADAVLSGVATDEHRLLLARRAAYGLPYAALVRHTRDPLGDLEAGRLAPLIAAALDDAGVRPPHLAGQ
jgi:hypothetical protein